MNNNIVVKTVLSMGNFDCDCGGELIPVHGFGFMPHCVNREMERRFQVNNVAALFVSLCICTIPEYLRVNS